MSKKEVENKVEVVELEKGESGVVLVKPDDNVITLKKPITFEGEKVKVITLDFEKLTGKDLERAEMQYTAEDPQNSLVMVKEMSKGYAAIVAAKAAGVPVELVRKLSAPDYAKLTMKTTVFLMGGE